jgi:CBS domain-containing protein
MNRDYPIVPGEVTLQDLVDKNVLTNGRRYFVVSNGGGEAGLVTHSTIREVPRIAWPKITASQIMIPLIRSISTHPTAELWTALEKMGRDGVNQLPVINGNGGNQIVGMLSRDDLLQYLRIIQALRK